MPLHFALTCFKTVFDVEVLSETASLHGLERALQRFEVKPKLKNKSKDQAKKALRLWSPAWYRGTRRGRKGVAHLSCLVLDFDGGISPNHASELWGEHHHILHSTWSHRPEHPKFRLCIPLARPVLSADWAKIWEWAQARCGGRADSATKSPGSTFALPAVKAQDQRVLGWVQEGSLLDPITIGLIAQQAPAAPTRAPAVDSPFQLGGDPNRRYLRTHERRNAPDWDEDSAFQGLF
ncbi:MAG: hypothetical protein ACI9VR_000806 [Cognaticolwellia sp.]